MCALGGTGSGNRDHPPGCHPRGRGLGQCRLHRLRPGGLRTRPRRDRRRCSCPAPSRWPRCPQPTSRRRSTTSRLRPVDPVPPAGKAIDGAADSDRERSGL